MDERRLQQGQTEAWTYLLRQDPQLQDALVIAVTSETLSVRETRFTLTLAGQREPVALIGRQTNCAEALFYQNFGRRIERFVPRCWLASEDTLANSGWLVLEDIGQHHPPRTWDLNDVARIGETMAHLHGAFWGMSRGRADWLPLKPELGLEEEAAAVAIDLFDPFFRTGTRYSPGSTQLPSSTVRAYLSNRLVSSTQIAAIHREQPELLSDTDVTTILTLLDQPELMIRPLLAMPFTVVHGSPRINSWRLTLFGECYLINWETVAFGPGALDLAQLLIHLLSLHKTIALGDDHTDHEIEELLVDSYFVALSQLLHEQFGYNVTYSSRYIRRYALPAAICWHMLQLLRRQPRVSELAQSPLKGLLPNLLHACRLLLKA